MMKDMKGNALGDITAEKDHRMLQEAFWETPDYKTIIDSSDRSVIVGRRGTGKSALTYKLNQFWESLPKSHVITIKPEEDQIIGLRDIINLFGDKFTHIKAGAKIIWRYAIYMEIISWFASHYKYKKDLDVRKVKSHISFWSTTGGSITFKTRKKLTSVLDKNLSPQSLVANLVESLSISVLEDAIAKAIDSSKVSIYILVDSVDEGYSPDNLGIALVDGFLQAIIDINSPIDRRLHGLMFIRDNIYRSIALFDHDFTRNIEAYTLRLHWDEYHLFNLVCNRLKVAFNDSTENSTKLWNKYTARELQGKEGFKRALRLTLYRPRDILVLLNNAYLHANGQDRKEIILEDIDHSSKSISEHRLNDLHKEYDAIFPSLDLFTKSFTGSSPYLTYTTSSERILPVLEEDSHRVDKQKDIVIFESPFQVMQRLYSVGFIGIKDVNSSSYIFSHDGRAPNKDIAVDSKFLVHPCYWLALNISEQVLNPEETEEIYDEYDIEISSISEEQRNKRIGYLLANIATIPLGQKGAYDFESWCFDVIRIIFAGALCNIEIHPNKNGLQQRDIIATNLCTIPVWKRIFNDYKSRQIVFEIKNIRELGSDEYRQINTYLSGTYGNCGFIICRDNEDNLTSGKDLNWAREMYYEQNKIIVKLSEKFLTKYLSKQRKQYNIQKHDEVSIALNKLIDRYIRQYLIIKAK